MSPAPVFIEMTSFSPDGGAFGPELSLVQNVLPMHGGWQPLRKKQVVAGVSDGPMRGAYVHVYQQTVNIQESGPISTLQASTWLAAGGMGSDLVDKVADTFPSDPDFIYAAGAPTQVAPGQSLIFTLPATWVDPVSGADHYYRWRYRVPSTTGAWSVQLELADEPVAVTSITRAATTATATTAAPHGWATGQILYMVGATQTPYNGRYTITVTGASTFTYAVAGAPATPATGTIAARAVWKSDTASGTGSVTTFTQREVLLTAGEANAIVAAGYGRFRLILTAVVAGAAQFARPVSDIAVGGWKTNLGLTANLFATIDETVASDLDYLKSPALAESGAAATYEAELGALTDPLTDTGYTLRYRLRASNAGVQVVARLMQGATVIKESTHTPAATFATQTITLAPAEWALVGDSDALSFQAEASYPTSAASTSFQESAPDADVSAFGFAPSSGAQFFPMVDEASPNDADYFACISPTGFSSCELHIAEPVNPSTFAGHSFSVRTSGPPSTQCTVRLKSAGTVVREETVTNTLATHTFNLTSGEGSLLIYANLTIEFVPFGISGGQGFTVYWVRFYTPELRWAELSWQELEGPSPARAEVSWIRVQIPGIAQSYRGDVPTILAGSKTKLYEVSGKGFGDISVAANYGAGAVPGFWHFAAMGNDPIVTNRADPVQYRAGNAGLFANLITSTLKPQARFCAVVRNHLVLADINLVGHFPDEVWWSYFDNARDFDNAPQGQGGFQRIVSRPGQIMGITGGDVGVIFKRNSMHLMGWQGGQLPFRFDDISSATGTSHPSSIVQTPYGVFFFDGSTFRLYAGGLGEESLADIGNGVLAQFLSDTFSEHNVVKYDPADIYEEDAVMTGVWDPLARVVIWTYPHARGEGGLLAAHTHGVVYNPQENRWGFLLIEEEILLGNLTPGMNSSCWASSMTGAGSATSHLRGTNGFSWDATNGRSEWFRFDDPRTYRGYFNSKARALGVEGVPEEERAPKAARLTGLMPVFTRVPEGVRVPALAGLVTASNDPWFFTGVQQRDADLSLVNAQGILPLDLSGTWFRFSAVMPELTTHEARQFRGFYAFWDWAGSPGSR